MNVPQSNIFDSETYVIDEQTGAFHLESHYAVFNDKAEQIGKEWNMDKIQCTIELIKQTKL